MISAINFLLESVVGFFVLTLLLRFALQVVRAPWTNPLAQFALGLTDWLVLPIRRWLPTVFGWDLAPLSAAWVCAWVMKVLEVALRQGGVDFVSGMSLLVLALAGFLYVLQMGLYLLIGATFMLAILSWLQPNHPFFGILLLILQPFLRPLQRWIPAVGGVDLAPLVLILLLQLLQYFVLPGLQSGLYQLLFGL